MTDEVRGEEKRQWIRGNRRMRGRKRQVGTRGCREGQGESVVDRGRQEEAGGDRERLGEMLGNAASCLQLPL